MISYDRNKKKKIQVEKATFQNLGFVGQGHTFMVIQEFSKQG